MRVLEQNDQRQYPIVITDEFEGLRESIKQNPSSICIITDNQVATFYLEQVKAILNTLAPTYEHIIDKGEVSKNLETVSQVYHTLTTISMDRTGLIVALGGGVVGDLAGFVASTYMRGVPFIQIPTTIVAQNDSSVGGKVGVDYLDYKNMVGAFYNPELVYINVGTLATLPKREIWAGMSEVIKHGIIRSKELFGYLEFHKDSILNLDTNYLVEMTYQSIKIKADVVEQDPKEKGLRKILNFGHTIGHAIETLSRFTLLHGECVGYGMVMVAYMSWQRGMIEEQVLQHIIKMCKDYGLLAPLENEFNQEEVYTCMLHDKKKSHGKVDFILIPEIGKAIICNDVDKQEVIQALSFIKKTCQ